MSDDLASSSSLISAGITLIAAFLGLRQWYEWRARDVDLPEEDLSYFFRQDVRRALGVAVMLILAAGLFIGSRIPAKVDGRANLAFVRTWLVISVLIIVMLGLALLDWISTRRYARREHRALADERRRILRETFQKKAGDGGSEPE